MDMVIEMNGPFTRDEDNLFILTRRIMVRIHVYHTLGLPFEVLDLISRFVVNEEREDERQRQMFIRRDRRIFRQNQRWYQGQMGALHADTTADYLNTLHPNSRIRLQLDKLNPSPSPRRADCTGPDSDCMESEDSTPPSPQYSNSSSSE